MMNSVNMLMQRRARNARPFTYAVLVCLAVSFAPTEAPAYRGSASPGGTPPGLEQIDQQSWQRILALRSETSVATLREALADPSQQIRFVAVVRLASYGTGAIAAFDQLADILANDPSRIIRSYSGMAIRQLGADPERVSVALSRMPGAQRTIMSIQGTGTRRPQSARPPVSVVVDLSPNLPPSMPQGRSGDIAVMQALIREGDLRAASAIARAWLHEDALPSRQRLALENISHLLSLDDARPHITRLLRSKDVEVCRAAIRATLSYGNVAGDVFVAALEEGIDVHETGVDCVEALSRMRSLPAHITPVLAKRFDAEITRAQGCAQNGHYGNSCRSRLQIVASAVARANPEAATPGLRRMLESSCAQLGLTAGQLLRQRNELPADLLELVLARATAAPLPERQQWLAVLSRYEQFDLKLVRNFLGDSEAPNSMESLRYAINVGNYARNNTSLRDALMEGFEDDDANIRLGCTLALVNVPQLEEPRVRAALEEYALAAAPQNRALFLMQLNRTDQLQGAMPAVPVASPADSRIVSRGSAN